MTGVVRKPHPDLAALIANELETRHGSTATWGEHIALAVAEWLTSPETVLRVEFEVSEMMDTKPSPELRAAVSGMTLGQQVAVFEFSAGLGAAVWENPQ